MFRWYYTSKVACPDRDCIVLADDEVVFRRLLNDNQTDSVAGTVEIKTGEVSYEV